MIEHPFNKDILKRSAGSHTLNRTRDKRGNATTNHCDDFGRRQGNLANLSQRRVQCCSNVWRRVRQRAIKIEYRIILLQTGRSRKEKLGMFLKNKMSFQKQLIFSLIFDIVFST